MSLNDMIATFNQLSPSTFNELPPDNIIYLQDSVRYSDITWVKPARFYFPPFLYTAKYKANCQKKELM